MLTIHPRPFFCGQQPPILTHLKGADVLHEQEGWPACLELLDRARRDLVHELAKHHAVLQYLSEVPRWHGFPHHGLDPLEDLLLLIGVARGHVSSRWKIESPH